MRRELLNKVKRVVVKIGSRVLTDADGGLDLAVIGQICDDISVLRSNRAAGSGGLVRRDCRRPQ